MKKKLLSALVCAALVTSVGAVVNNSVVHAASSTAQAGAVQSVSAKMVVDSKFAGTDGSMVNGVSTFKTLGAAMKQVSSKSAETVVVIKSGVYKEMVKISKPNVKLIAEFPGTVVLTYDAGNKMIKRAQDGGDGVKKYGTSGSASITIAGSATGFEARNITFKNSYNEAADGNSQAVAVKSAADKAIFVNCRFIGNQDTLYPDDGRQYFKDCYIEGDTDFIFGGATAVFENCEIRSVDRDIEPKGYVTAPSTDKGKKGFLIINSKLTTDIKEANSVYLGRPWHAGGKVKRGIAIDSGSVFKNCELGAHIKKEGWTSMNSDKPADNSMFEYGNTGAGAIQHPTRRQLTDAQAKEATVEGYFGDWDAKADLTKLLKIKA